MGFINRLINGGLALSDFEPMNKPRLNLVDELEGLLQIVIICYSTGTQPDKTARGLANPELRVLDGNCCDESKDGSFIYTINRLT
jgi:hypothetical protein